MSLGRIVALTVALTLVDMGNPGVCMADESVTYLRERVPGVKLKAFVVAFAEFQKTGFLIENYTVAFRELDREVEVVFIPDPNPDEHTRGGRTMHGREVHYRVSLDRWEIVKTSYGR